MPRAKSNPKRLCVSLESRVFYKKDNIDTAGIRAVSNELKRLAQDGIDVVLVVGGGPLGARYLKIVHQFSRNREQLDQIESMASMVNAKLFVESLRVLKVRTFPKPASTQGEIADFFSSMRGRERGFVVAAGIIEPGKTPKQCAAAISKRLGGQLVIASDIQQLEKL